VTDRYNPRVPLDMPAGDWPLRVEVTTSDGETRSAGLGRVTVTTPERSFAMPELQYPLDVALGETVELLGYDLTGLDGPTVGLTLYWRTLQEMEIDYTVFTHLVAADGTLVGQADSMPRGGAYPTSLWAVGEVVSDQYQIPVSPGAALPLSLRVGMYLPLTGEQLGEAVVLEW
jgi:hypothetical protein